MKAGFVPALGTPLDKEGNFVKESYKRQIDDQIKAGAVGILCMGSMGQQAYLSQSLCPQIAEAAIEAAAGRVPVFVGAMDCSIRRAKERIAALDHLPIDAYVFTTPYYNPCSRDQVINYFKGVAAATDKPILLYDLAVVTQAKITYDMVLELIREIPNLKGIKSADTLMFRKLRLNPNVPEDFIMVYSGLDMFDIAYKWGIDNCLDGMMTCTPVNSKQLFDSMAEGDYVSASAALDRIVALRDLFVAKDLWPAYTTAMNILGYQGDFGPDYVSPIKEEFIEDIREMLVDIGELES